MSREAARGPVDQVADLVVFAPLGFALEVRRLVPELAARGRRQLLFTRTVGKYAVRRARQRADDLVATGVGLASAFLPSNGASPVTAEAPAEGVAHLTAVASVPADDGPESDHLAIPDYDNLSAFQVMPRLEALDPSDLDAVRAYEESTRGRRTILNKIAQLS